MSLCSPKRAAAPAAALLAAAVLAAGCGGGDDEPAARPSATPAGPQEQARVVGEALTLCANAGVVRRAKPSKPGLYASEGMVRMSRITTVLKGVRATGQERQVLDDFIREYSRLGTQYTALQGMAARKGRRAAADRRRLLSGLRAGERKVQELAGTSGIPGCGPLSTV
jgi:hypothetical protein